MYYIATSDTLLNYSDTKYDEHCKKADFISATEYEENTKKAIVQNSILIPNPDWSEIELQEAKQNKYFEALEGAKYYIDSVAVYQFDENNSIEATDGNIGKMTAYALAFQTGTVEVVYWTSKEDNVLELNANDVLNILTGLGEAQAVVWNVKFVTYKNAINEAQTVEEVNAIVIDYSEEI